MIFTVDFGEAQTGVGYQFIQANGSVVGPRHTNIGDGAQAGIYFTDVTPPLSAVLIYWDCDDPTLTAREDFRELRRLDIMLTRPPVPALISSASEYYNTAKAGFLECLDMLGIPIIFSGIQKLCITGRIDEKLNWQNAGFLDERKVQADMLDDDFAEFLAVGIADQNIPVTIEGVLYQLNEIYREPTDPTVHLAFVKDK